MDQNTDAKSAALDPRPGRVRHIMSDEATRLLHRTHSDWDREPPHGGPCNHGTFSPRPTAYKVRGSDASTEAAQTFGGAFEGSVSRHTTGIVQRLLENAIGNDGGGDGPRTSRWRADQQGIKHSKSMYVYALDMKPTYAH